VIVLHAEWMADDDVNTYLEVWYADIGMQRYI
jgi:hypothetical protein